MDFNENLRQQIRLALRIRQAEDRDEEISTDDAAELAELVIALHEWITHGGSLPTSWRTKC